MNRILFDGTATQNSILAKYHGGGEYAKFILQSALTKGYKFDIVFGTWLEMDDEVRMIIEKYSDVNVHYVKSKKDLYNLIDNYHYSIFYSALGLIYSDYNCKARLIGTIHGLRSAELPWDFYRYKYEENLIRRLLDHLISHCMPIQKYIKKKHIAEGYQLLNIKNAKFLTVSNHTKYSLLSFYTHLTADSLYVFYSPFSIKNINKTDSKDNYFLMVSGNRYEKNVYRAVLVFDKLFSEGRLNNKRVVITGCGNEPFWKEIKNREKFELLPYVLKEKLDTLYKEAFCFVYPSLNEGFGYPPLMAMAHGTPVIASSSTSIPEICGDAACYFSPLSVDDLSARILFVSNDESLRNDLVIKGLRRVEELLRMQNVSLDKMLKFVFE